MSFNLNGVPIIENVGTLGLFSGITDPNGWAICDGISRSNASGQYNNLITAGVANQNSFSTSFSTQIDNLNTNTNTLIAVSGDGNTIILNGKYLTTNAGQSYSFLYSPYNTIPSAYTATKCVISNDGKIIVMNGYQSTTQGATWTTNACSTYCAINSAGNLILIDSGTSTYIMLSNDSGQSYNQISGLSSGPYINNGLPTTTATVYGLCMSSSGLVMAALISSSFTLYLSTNGGNYWNTVSNLIGTVSTICISGDGKTIAYTGTSNYVSSNQGVSWPYSNARIGFLSYNGNMGLDTYYTLWSFYGTSWTGFNMSQGQQFMDATFWNGSNCNTAKPDFSAIYYSLKSPGGNLMVSYNYCKHWIPLVGLSQNRFVAIREANYGNSISSTYNGLTIISASTYLYSNGNLRGQIIKSTDGGATWNFIFGDWKGPYNCAISGDGNVMGWTYLYSNVTNTLSTDGGKTFVNIGGGASNNGNNAIKMNYTGSVIYAPGLGTTTDTGKTWRSSGINFRNGSVFMSYSGREITGADANYLYLSTNYGYNFKAISGPGNTTGLTTATVGASINCAISDDGNTMLAALQGYHVYLSTNKGISFTQLSGPGGINSYLPTTGQNWWSLSMSGDATKMLIHIVGPGATYFSSDSGTTFTNINSGATPYNGVLMTNGAGVGMSGDGSRFFLFSLNYGLCISTNGTFWYNPTFNSGSTNGLPENVILGGTNTNTWQTYSMSGNGTYALAGNNGSTLYLSNDGGYGFFMLGSNGNLKNGANWKGTAISTTGQFMLAVGYNASVYYSNTYGAYWYQVSGVTSNPYFTTTGLPTSTSAWNTCAMDGTGQFLLAGINSGSLYLSTSYASYWTTISGAANTYGLPTVASAWSVSAISTNASFMLAGINSGILYMSTNAGNNWVLIGGTNSGSTFGLPTFASAWSTVSINSSGSYMLAGINSGSLFMSSTSGAYWVKIAGASNGFGLPTSAGAWTCSAINNSGSVMTAAINGKSLYLSNNSGKTWTPSNPFLATRANWQTIAMNSSGTYITAAENTGYIYNIKTVAPTNSFTPITMPSVTTIDGTTLKYIVKY